MSRKHTPKSGRRANSLSSIVEKLIAPFPAVPIESESWEMSISELTEMFGAEKNSRVYEALGILESILIVSKIGREIYRWNGFGQLKKTLAFLRVTAEKLAMPSEISKLEEKNKDEYFAAAMVLPEKKKEVKQDEQDDAEPGPSNLGMGDNSSGEKPSLQVICQKLLMIFLLESKKPLQLKFCSQVIGQGKFDVTRRLYDIANTFEVLHLLRHVHVDKHEGRVRAFEDNESLWLEQTTLAHIKKPFTAEEIHKMESLRMRVILLEGPESSEDLVGVEIDEGESVQGKLSFAILADQKSFEESFN